MVTYIFGRLQHFRGSFARDFVWDSLYGSHVALSPQPLGFLLYVRGRHRIFLFRADDEARIADRP